MQFLSMYIADQKRWFLKKNMILAIFMIQIINNLVLFREIPRVSETDVLSALILSVDDPFFYLNYMVIAIVFATEYCKQKENHFLQFCMIRCRDINYILPKLLNSFLSGFFTMCSATALWLLSLRMFIPWAIMGVGQYDICIEWGMGDLLGKQLFLHYFALICVGLGLLAGILAVLSFLCSLLIPSQTLVLIIPTLSVYLLESLIGDYLPSLNQWRFYYTFFYPYNYNHSTDVILKNSLIHTGCGIILMGLLCYIIVKIQKKQEKWYV